MAVRNEGAVHSYLATSAVEMNRLVKGTAGADHAVEYATDGSVPIIGSTHKDDTVAAGHVAVQSVGIGSVEASGAIAAWTPLTATADGKAAAAGATDWIVGWSLEAATGDGTVISYLIAHSKGT